MGVLGGARLLSFLDGLREEKDDLGVEGAPFASGDDGEVRPEGIRQAEEEGGAGLGVSHIMSIAS